MITPLNGASPAPSRTSADTAAPAPRTITAAAAPAAESTVVNLSQPGSSFKTVLDYLPADANQDGQVGELERRAFELQNPSVTMKQAYQAVSDSGTS